MSKLTPASDMTRGFLAALKRRKALGQVWSVRGAIFARIMVNARDARLSGAEWSVLSTVALHLQHLGRSRGMMSVETLADDCMVTPRTVRNALRTLSAQKFIHAKVRGDGKLTLSLDARFGPRAAVAANASSISPRRSSARKTVNCVDKSRGLSAAGKKISASAPRSVSHTLPLLKSYSPQLLNIPAQLAVAGRAESPGEVFSKSERPTARKYIEAAVLLLTTSDGWKPGHLAEAGRILRTAAELSDHDPPRKRATPASPG